MDIISVPIYDVLPSPLHRNLIASLLNWVSHESSHRYNDVDKQIKSDCILFQDFALSDYWEQFSSEQWWAPTSYCGNPSRRPPYNTIIVEASNQIRLGWLGYKPTLEPQQTRRVEPVLFQCWTSVVDGGPILKQHWCNDLCLQGRLYGKTDDVTRILHKTRSWIDIEMNGVLGWKKLYKRDLLKRLNPVTHDSNLKWFRRDR